MTRYRDGGGALTPGRCLGSGGEGDVYALPDYPTRALKLYRTPDRAREAKVRSMVDAGLATGHPDVAFPASVVVDARGAFAGFTMALAEGSVPIHELYSPASRRREFPRADWRFLVRAATNVAHAFGLVHAAGAVIGDVNGSGVLVSRRATATLIDADSFQWGPAHPCRVGVPDFTPPELQGRSIDGVERTADHDGYGLAVLVFHLLFLGRHPSAGRPLGRDLPLHEAIRQHVFPYSRIRRSNVASPPNTVLLSDLPLGVALLFERAFSGSGARPSPGQWVAELDRLETGLVPCPRNPSHRRPGGGACPWCRIDAVIGTPTFAAAPAGGARPEPPLAIEQPAFRTQAATFATRARRSTGEGMVPPGLRGNSVAGATTIGGGSGDPVDHRSPSSAAATRPTDARSAERAHAAAVRGLQIAIDDWRTRIGAWRAAGLVSAVENEIDRQREVERRHAQDLLTLDRRLEREAVMGALRSAPLASARIPGVGAGISARLVAAGIVSAADVSLTALEAVPRIGDRARTLLMLWRDGLAFDVERRFRTTPQSIAAAEEGMRRTRASTLATDAATLERLTTAAKDVIEEVTRRSGLPDRALETAIAALVGARSDLRRLGVDPILSAVPRPAAPKTGGAAAPRGAAACPACGGPMVRRWARGGSGPGRFFLGCASYPACIGSRSDRRGRP